MCFSNALKIRKILMSKWRNGNINLEIKFLWLEADCPCDYFFKIGWIYIRTHYSDVQSRKKSCEGMSGVYELFAPKFVGFGFVWLLIDMPTMQRYYVITEC